MGDSTGISWTDATWNPVRGCSRVSEGCRNCYAERVAARFSGPGMPYEGLATLRRARRQTGPTGELTEPVPSRSAWTGEVRLIAEHLADPMRWRRPRRIFVNSMSDLFHERLTNEQIAAVFGVMAAAPQHTFQVLTKRAKRMRKWFELTLEHGAIDVCLREAWLHLCDPEAPSAIDAALERVTRNGRPTAWPLPNVHLGVSVENQAAADERIPELLATPAVVRFLSCEPLLGPVDISHWIDYCERLDKRGIIRRDGGLHSKCDAMCGISWVIAGCESGPGARSCDVAWLRSLRDQCAAAGVPYFLKQARSVGDDHLGAIAVDAGSKRKAGGVIELPYLDGVQHAAFPDHAAKGFRFLSCR